MTTENLTEYLRKLYELEKVRYTVGTLYNRMSNNIAYLEEEKNNLVHRGKMAFAQEDTNKRKVSLFTVIAMAVLGAVVGLILSFIPALIWEFLGRSDIIEVFAALIGGCIGAGYALMDEVSTCSIVNREVKKKNQEIVQHNMRIAERNRQNAERLQTINHSLPLLYHEQDKIHSQYNMIKNTLKKYYSFEIMDRKYWFDFVAICSFYEYFRLGMTRRLTVSENGADVGAYNKYEDELLHRTIIGKLDDVIQRLDQIERNQRMLYDAIQESNRNIQRVSQQIEKISRDTKATLDSIEHNTELAAFHSGVAAANSEYLKWADVIRTLT